MPRRPRFFYFYFLFSCHFPLLKSNRRPANCALSPQRGRRAAWILRREMKRRLTRSLGGERVEPMGKSTQWPYRHRDPILRILEGLAEKAVSPASARESPFPTRAAKTPAAARATRPTKRLPTLPPSTDKRRATARAWQTLLLLRPFSSYSRRACSVPAPRRNPQRAAAFGIPGLAPSCRPPLAPSPPPGRSSWPSNSLGPTQQTRTCVADRPGSRSREIW